METEITDLLENFEFPEFSLADSNPKVDAFLVLGMYGHSCMKKKIKFRDIKNMHNSNLHFISENAGKLVTIEIQNNEIVERLRLRYNTFFDGYEPTSPEPYELVFREDRNL